ncbi:MAG: molybdopterin-binding protein, partial [Acidobacteriota bacterium]
GGVGPTHDDVTMRAVAQAFGREIVLDPSLVDLLERYFKDRLTDDHLRMARVPEGAEMVTAPGVRWPTVLMGNVFILPGLPEVFVMKMPTLRHRIGAHRPFLSRAVATRSDEAELASLLDELDARFPEVSIGSYPRWGDGPVKVKITFDGRDPEAVDRAIEALRQGLAADQIVEEECE